MSPNLTIPSISERIGIENGSHSAIRVGCFSHPRLRILAGPEDLLALPDLEVCSIGHGITATGPSLVIHHMDFPVPVHDHKVRTPGFPVGFTLIRIHHVEAFELDGSVMPGLKRGIFSNLAVPPIWKVRMVSCVPGSPMDCAAMIPTASPMFAR